MGTEPEELRTEIAETRADLSNTLDAIGDRVSPGRMIERRKNRMTESVQSMRDRVMGTAHDASDTASGVPDQIRERTQGAPMLAGAVAFGIGFLVAAALPTSRAEREMAPALLEKVEPLKEELVDAGKQAAQHLAPSAQETTQAVREAATEGVRTVVDQAKESTGQAKDESTQTPY